MRHLRVPALATTVMAMLALALPVQAATPTLVTCGFPVIESIVLANSLLECDQAGLVVSADNVTINLNGHLVDGDAIDTLPTVIEAGIDNSAGHSDVRVINGYVGDFEAGAYIVGTMPAPAADNAIKGVSFHANDTGVLIEDATDAKIDDASVLGNGIGMYIDGGSGHKIDHATASGNAGSGIVLFGGSDHSIKNSAASANSTDGFHVAAPGGSGHRISKSAAFGNSFRGVLVSEGQNHTLNGVSAWGNVMQGVLVFAGTGHVVKKGTVTGNGGDGVGLSIGSGNSIQKSVVAGNGGDGIDVASGDLHAIVGNTAYRNGFMNGLGDPVGLGVRIALGVTNLVASKNKAGDNDEDTAQCSVAANCTAFTPPPATLVQCGDDVNASIVIGNSLFNCALSGLEIKADNVVVTATGFRIDGNAIPDDPIVESGVDNVEGHPGLEVLGGLVSGFEAGVYVKGAGATSNRVEGTHAGSNIHGFYLDTATGVVLDGVSAATSPTGIKIDAGGGGHLIDGATTWGTASFGGIRITSSTGDTITDSISVWNGTDGIHLSGATGTVIETTTVAANEENGIETDGSGAQIEKVIASSNELNGIEMVSGASTNTVTKGKAFGNGNAGIAVDGSQNVIEKSTTSRNGRRGIYVTGADHTVTGVKADLNGYGNGINDADGFGIEVVAATNLAAFKNKARLNDADAMQCSVEANCNA